MNCGNLPSVAVALRAKWPHREFILAADSDAWILRQPRLDQSNRGRQGNRRKAGRAEFSRHGNQANGL